jgi:hypothetical protein
MPLSAFEKGLKELGTEALHGANSLQAKNRLKWLFRRFKTGWSKRCV